MSHSISPSKKKKLASVLTFCTAWPVSQWNPLQIVSCCNHLLQLIPVYTDPEKEIYVTKYINCSHSINP